VLIRTQVQLLRTLLATIADLESRIATPLASHPRATQLASLPGVGTINLAQLLAEVGPILDRVGSAEQAAAECGAAPVTKASGKTSGVYFRWAANRRARKALTAFAHNSRLASPWAGRLYADARARGKRNPHATRIVAHAWLRVIWACWQQATPYNPPLTAALRATAPPT
jgi:transposase